MGQLSLAHFVTSVPIGYSGRPLRGVESTFTIDSSGFSLSKFEKWFDHKHGTTRFKHAWVKVQIACGTKTNVVTAVRILDKDAADSPQFVPLIRETKRHFVIGEVSADKAYASLENFEEVSQCGGQAFIAFKSNTTGAVGGQFEKAFHYFQFKNEEYQQHYTSGPMWSLPYLPSSGSLGIPCDPRWKPRW